MIPTVQQLVSDINALASLPEASIRINQMVDDPNCSAEDIGKIISQDPALTVRLLKIANSPFYSLSNKIDTVSRAITILGTSQLRDMVLATSAVKAFEGIPNTLVSMENFWYHSISCGLTARILAAECLKNKGETLFVAGLLHDIGQLVIFNKIPELAKEALLYSLEGPTNGTLHLAEQKILGFDHMQVGAELAHQWQLPENLRECIAFHHTPAEATLFPQEVALIHIAQAIACMVEIKDLTEDDKEYIDPLCWQITGLTEAVVEPTIEAVQAQLPDVLAMFSSPA